MKTINCIGHDACKNNVWTGEYNINCGASNSERTCKSTTLNCGENNDCSIKTQGSEFLAGDVPVSVGLYKGLKKVRPGIKAAKEYVSNLKFDWGFQCFQRWFF